MDTQNIAGFICELRKAKGLTQKQLAGQLNITDKAVSKWERGLGYPDITTLVKLAEILDVTTNELLSGKREEASAPKPEIIVRQTFQYAEKVSATKNKRIQNVLKITLTALFLIALLTCIICDLAVFKGLTWSLYVIVGIVFAWLIIIPLLHFEKKGITVSLISLSIFIFPFLFCLERIINATRWFVPLGIPIAFASIAYLWFVFAIFVRSKINRWYACGIALIMVVPLNFIINYAVARITTALFFDIWDAFELCIILVMAVVLFAVGYLCKTKHH